MLILFDVDGVLVHSQAYHSALQQTIAYFATRMGLPPHTLTPEEIAVFESQGIIVEWESSAICVAALLRERLTHQPPPPLAENFVDAIEQLRQNPFSISRPDFVGLARQIGSQTEAGGRPSHTAMRLFQKMFPQAKALFAHLLERCYEVERAPATQVFQNYALGHEAFTRHYGLPQWFESAAMLETHDRALLHPNTRDRLLAHPTANVALYTARPSLAPVELGNHLQGYTPEAEMARTLVGLSNVPALGFGKVDWLGKQKGGGGMTFVKPSPVHALAAMGAAISRQEVASLEAAYQLAEHNILLAPLTALHDQTVHIFEDSASSLRGVTKAIALLNKQGLNVRMVRHGIAPQASPKRETLAAIADVMYEDVNQGIETLLEN